MSLDELKDLCQICYVEKFKYKCPKCATKTCSLECVKKHKTQSQCDGVIDNTKFIKRKEFEEDDKLVHRDYNFLMNLNRTIEVSKNDVRSKNKKILSNFHNNNKRFQRNAASTEYETIVKRSVKIRTVPKGMQRSQMNKSGWDKKKNTYVWTVEWILMDPETGKEISKHFTNRMPEGTKLIESIHNKIKEELQDKPVFCFLRKIDTPASTPQFIPLNNDDFLADALRDQTVIEFPTILVSTKNEIHGYSAYEESDSDSDSSEDSSDSSSSSDDSDSDEDESEEDDGDGPEEVSSKAPVEVSESLEEGQTVELKTKDENTDNYERKVVEDQEKAQTEDSDNKSTTIASNAL